MSNFLPEYDKPTTRNGMSTFGIYAEGTEAIEQARMMLAGIPGGISSALKRSLKRATTAGKTYAAKVLTQHYYIKSSDFKGYTETREKITSDGAEIEFKGYHIPLSKFHVTSGRGVINATVRRGAGGSLPSAFWADVGSHRGVFERVGSERLPIREFFGPAAPQMMDANDDIAGEIADRVMEQFTGTLQHEIDAILNGYHSIERHAARRG